MQRPDPLFLQATDEQLMMLAASGKRPAFEQLYDRYFEKLSWYAFSFLKEMTAAEDIVQDVFCVVITKPDSFNTTQRFSTWIYTLVGNRCRNEIRNRTNRAALLRELLPTDEQSALPAHDPALAGAIRTLVSALSDKERLVYHLRFEEDLKVKEIAAVADLPEGSVKSCIYYLVQKLSQQLKAIGYGK